MTKGRLLLVGRRGAALRTVARRGLDVLGVAAGTPLRGRAPYVALDTEPGAAWIARAVARLRAAGPFRAAIALQEATVEIAAQLRAGLGIPGDDVATAERCTDKLRMKEAVSAAGIRCAPFLEALPALAPREAAERLGLPLVWKPRRAQGGRGRRIFRSPGELPAAWPPGGLVEGFVPGVEMSIETLLCNGAVTFTSPTEYLEPGWSNLVPAVLARADRTAVAALNERAIRALGVREGVTHLELFLTDEGPVFGELAARPPGGYLMELIERVYGFDPWESLFDLALGGDGPAPTAPRRYAAVQLFHAGAGRVRAVHGVAAALRLPGIERVRVRIAAGDEIGERLGIGQEVGHVLVSGPDREETTARLARAVATISIEMEG